jgi:peptidoglycan/xylan/chitin deacetylase (PgdA/CDA1 family)
VKLSVLALWALASMAPAASLLQAVCYHRFAADCGKDPYCTSDAELAQQLDWLKAEGWQSVGLSQVAAAFDQRAPLPEKALLLSVDDGFKAGARGADAFEARGFKGVFFVNPGSLARGKKASKSAYMSAEDLRALEARGHSIGSHGRTHANLGKVPPGLSVEAYQGWLRQELEASKAELEAILGHPVADLAWPFGAYNEAVLAAAQKIGYRQFYTVTDATAQVPGTDRARLPRYLFKRPTSLTAFKRHINAADAPPQLDGSRDGQIEYSRESPRGFRFIQKDVGGRPAKVLVQRAVPEWKPYFDSLLTPLSESPDAP